jgi:geranylgeranyl pyrophosphate synthase
MLAARAAGGQVDQPVCRAAVAVEMIHCYSLVHDDLPAMDDDRLRRGRPTVHVQFGEAMAILVGDALLTQALAVLAEADHPRSARLVLELARAAGAGGMIAGQVADMDLCSVADGARGLRQIHLGKTAALIRASARLGALCAGADAAVLDALSTWAQTLGLAFQLFDDILDVTGEADRIGKTPGKDARTGKRTYLAELGLQGSIDMGRRLTGQADQALAPLGADAAELLALSPLLADRTH